MTDTPGTEREFLDGKRHTCHAHCPCSDDLRERAAKALRVGMAATWGEAPTAVDARNLIDGVFDSAGVDETPSGEAGDLRERVAQVLNDQWPHMLNDGLQHEVADAALSALRPAGEGQ